MVQFSSIRSENQQLFSQAINKIGLSPYDDKRYVLGDKITTLAHGHCKIEKLRTEDMEKIKETYGVDVSEKVAVDADKVAENDNEEKNDDVAKEEEYENDMCHICKKETDDLIIDKETHLYECVKYDEIQKKYISLHKE